MDKESIDFAYKYLVPEHLFKGFVCTPLFIMSNTSPCRYRDNDIYKFPKKIKTMSFSFVSSVLKVRDSMGGSFYLFNFILDLKEMNSFRNPPIDEGIEMPFKYSHYVSPSKSEVEKGLKILTMPTKVLNCREFDVLSLGNKKKLKYSESRDIIYKWLKKKKT